MTTVRNVEPFLVFLFFFVGNAILTSLHAEFFLTGLKCLATDESAECENHPIDLSLSLSLYIDSLSLQIQIIAIKTENLLRKNLQKIF